MKVAVPSSLSLNKKLFFLVGLVILTCSVRSEILVDRSYLPRFLLFTLILLITCMAVFQKGRLPQISLPYLLVLIAYYLWNLMSAIWSIAPSESLVQSQLFFLSLLLFVMISDFVRNDSRFEPLFIKALIILLFLSFGLGFMKMFSLRFFDPYKIISVSANNNLYAGFLLISFPFTLAGYKMLKGSWRYLSVASGILAIFFLVIVQSRAAYLGMAVSMLTFLVIVPMRFRSVLNHHNLATGAVAIAILTIAIFGFYRSLDETRRHYFLSKIPVWSYFISYDDDYALKLEKKRAAIRAGNIQNGAFDFSEDYYENANLRILFWKKSASLIATHPMLGVGAGNWRLAIPSVTQPANPEHTVKNYTYSQPHNEWIGVATELGLIGAILSLMVFFAPPFLAFRKLLGRKTDPDLETAIYASFSVGFLLFAAFDFPLKRVEHNILLFAIFAFLMARIPLPQKWSFMPSGWIKRLLPILVSAVLIFTLVIVLFRMKGEFYTLKMFKNERKNAAKVIEYSRSAGSAFYRITPNTLPLDWFEGVAHMQLGDAQSALGCFQKALRYTPSEVRVLNDYGVALSRLKRNKEAKSVFLTTYETDPWFDDAKFNLAAIYYLTGQSDSALMWVHRCRDSEKKREFLESILP